MPRCICKNCNHSSDEHEDGRMCTKKMIFVQDNDYCPYFENDELFSINKLIAFTIVAIGIVLLCAKFL